MVDETPVFAELLKAQVPDVQLTPKRMDPVAKKQLDAAATWTHEAYAIVRVSRCIRSHTYALLRSVTLLRCTHF